MQREGKPSPAYQHAGPATALAGLFLLVRAAACINPWVGMMLRRAIGTRRGIYRGRERQAQQQTGIGELFARSFTLIRIVSIRFGQIECISPPSVLSMHMMRVIAVLQANSKQPFRAEENVCAAAQAH